MNAHLIVTLILELILAGILGLICALFSYLLDYTFWRGSIFQFWLPFLAKIILKNKDRESYDVCKKLPGEVSDDHAVKIAEKQFWYKVLGGCPVCLNIWIALNSSIIIVMTTQLHWWAVFPYILTSSFFIRKLTGNS